MLDLGRPNLVRAQLDLVENSPNLVKISLDWQVLLSTTHITHPTVNLPNSEEFWSKSFRFDNIYAGFGEILLDPVRLWKSHRIQQDLTKSSEIFIRFVKFSPEIQCFGPFHLPLTVSTKQITIRRKSNLSDLIPSPFGSRSKNPPLNLVGSITGWAQTRPRLTC